MVYLESKYNLAGAKCRQPPHDSFLKAFGLGAARVCQSVCYDLLIVCELVTRQTPQVIVLIEVL